MMTLAASSTTPTGGAEVGRHLDGEEQDADGEDDGDDAGLVDAQGQERGAALVHAPATHAAGVLDGDASLAFLDVDDDGHRGHDAEQAEGDAGGQVGRGQERAHGARQAGHDAGEDDEADAVADAALGDELADPHEQHGARPSG